MKITRLNLKIYKNIIFDNDGVLLDTNRIKEKNITEVVSRYAGPHKTDAFVKYFIKNNGVPREIKISKFFSSEETKAIVEEYNALNKISLIHAETTAGLSSFLNRLQLRKVNLFVISGSDEEELICLLKRKELVDYFRQIKGGPKTKEENLIDLNLKGSSLYIGDSLVDYQLAKLFGLDFIFMYGYTQFFSWQDFFKDKEIIMIIKDCQTFTNCIY